MRGRCVRLTRGSYRRCRFYSADPVKTARAFRSAGAKRLHVIDLDGARLGRPCNLRLAGRIARATHARVEFGGGIRNLESVTRAVDAGMDRVILGTAAFTDEVFLERALARYGSRIMASVDLKRGLVAVKGWRSTLELDGPAAIRRLAARGVRSIVYTDTKRDGTLEGVDVRGLRRILGVSGKCGVTVDFAGGVRDLEDLKRLDRKVLRGVVTGKAIYEGTLDLREALREARG